MCVSYRERTEKQRMYSVSHGLNSAWTTFVAFPRSADLALLRSFLWVWICRSTCRLVLARSADSWIYRENKQNCQFPVTRARSQHSIQTHSATDRKVTSWVEAAGHTLCVFLPAMSASFSPEPYRAKGCLLSLPSSLGCRAGAGLTRKERQACFEDLEGLLCCAPLASFSTNRKDKAALKYQEQKSLKWGFQKSAVAVDSSAQTVSVFQRDHLSENEQRGDEFAVDKYESIQKSLTCLHGMNKGIFILITFWNNYEVAVWQNFYSLSYIYNDSPNPNC